MPVIQRFKERIFWSMWLAPLWLTILLYWGLAEGHGLVLWPPATAMLLAMQ